MNSQKPSFSQDEILRWNTETSLEFRNLMEFFVSQNFPPESGHEIADLQPIDGTLGVILVIGKFVFSMSVRPASDIIVVSALLAFSREGKKFVELGSTVAETTAIAFEYLEWFRIKGKTYYGLSVPALKLVSIN